MTTYPRSLWMPRDYMRDPETGLNVGTRHAEVLIEIDPTLETLGEFRANPYGPCPIVLREWNEQVLLHELLHLLLGCPDATENDPHGHGTVARIEVALWETGWRLTPAAEEPRTEAQAVGPCGMYSCPRFQDGMCYCPGYEIKPKPDRLSRADEEAGS